MARPKAGRSDLVVPCTGDIDQEMIPASATNPLPVTVVAGGGGAAVEDAVSAADPSGSALIARRRDVPVATEVSNDGDYIALNADATGALNVNAGGPCDLVDATMTLHTSALTSGVVMGSPVALTNAMRVAGGRGILESLVVFDEDDQGFGLDLVFESASQALGTLGSNPSISDANARDILGIVSVVASDFIDLGGQRTATLRNVGLLLEAAAASRDIFVAAISRGTGTYTANGIRLRAGIIQA